MTSKQKITSPAKAKIIDFKLTSDVNSFNLQALVLIVIGLIFYGNSFKNEYALDDGIVIEKNEYVQDGFRGVFKILKTDAYDSFYKQMNAGQQLSGGRYRPLSIVTFALEQQFFGKKKTKAEKNITVAAYTELSTFRHVGNVLFYIFSVLLLLYFLREFIFKENVLIAFGVSLLFLIHPIHTEVVANVKSRDEILSFLFIMLTFIKAFQYWESKNKRYLIAGLIYYFLALLSKEYAVTLIVLIPMLFYIKRNETVYASFSAALPFLGVAAIYLFIRYSIVGTGASIENPDVLNNPFKFATPDQRLATKIEILNRYLRLLFYPTPLSSDYSYNTIPYTNFSDPNVWLSLFIHISMVVSAIVLFIKRNIISFALTFYLVHLLLVSNLRFEIGATMGERLIYHSSFGFCMVIGIAAVWALQRIKSKTTATTVGGILTGMMVIWFATITIARNAEWKNDTSLFIADAEKVPNSALVNGNAGKAYIDMSELPENKAREKELVQKSLLYLQRAVATHDQYVNGYLNLGVAYYKLGDYTKARECWDMARKIYPSNPFIQRNFALLGQLYYNEAMRLGVKNPTEAIKLLEKAVEVDPSNPDYWYNLGGASYTIQDYKRAGEAWTKALELKPDYEQAKQGLGAIQGK
jgi:protein O-mannosyl-transferase